MEPDEITNKKCIIIDGIIATFKNASNEKTKYYVLCANYGGSGFEPLYIFDNIPTIDELTNIDLYGYDDLTSDVAQKLLENGICRVIHGNVDSWIEYMIYESTGPLDLYIEPKDGYCRYQHNYIINRDDYFGESPK